MRYMGLRKSEALKMRPEWIDPISGNLSIQADGIFRTKTARGRVLFTDSYPL